MREILFRGKRIDNGEWLEGYYGFDDNKPLIAINKANGINGYFVAAETVGQYTGLTDKNGKKIFEGDIVFTTEPIGMGYREICGKVVYKAPKFYADCKNFIMLLDFDYGKADYAVIGNVYDNPELMK